MRTVYSLVLAAVLTVGTVHGSGKSTTTQDPAGVPLGSSGLRTTLVLDCHILEVLPDRTVVLKELDTDVRHTVRLDDEIKIKARHKRDFDGRRVLGFSDLRAGQEIKLTVDGATGHPLKIRVMGPAELDGSG